MTLYHMNVKGNKVIKRKKSLKILTVSITNPGDKVLKLLLVLNDCFDGIVFPLEGEAVVIDIIVRKPLDKVQPKHWRHTEREHKAKVTLNGKCEAFDRAGFEPNSRMQPIS